MSNLTLKKAWDWTRSHWKGILKTAGRLALVAIGICAALIVYEYASDKWDDHFGTRGSRMISKKHKIQVVYFADGTDRLKDLKTGRWTSPKLRWVANEPPVMVNFYPLLLAMTSALLSRMLPKMMRMVELLMWYSLLGAMAWNRL